MRRTGGEKTSRVMPKKETRNWRRKPRRKPGRKGNPKRKET